MSILVTGVKGQLGFDVVEELNKQGYKNIVGVDKEDFDITNEKEVNEYINKLKPSIIFHCAAYTQVDKAEEDKDLCYKVNALGTKFIANCAKENNSKLIYISTDYVFEGIGEFEYKVNDEKKPIGVYGSTKLQGEEFVKEILDGYFIVRISWVFGINGNNFIKTMLRLAETRNELSVVNDQIGSPTYTYDLAKLLVEMSKSTKYGVYHATNEGTCSWNEFAQYIFKEAKLNVKVNAITTHEYQKLVKQAKRPLNSRLDKSSLEDNGFEKLPNWKDAVKKYVKELI